MLTFAELAMKNKARCESATGFNHPISSWSLSDWMTALAGEVGEAANIIKKMNRHRDKVGLVRQKETPRELYAMLAKELADIQAYLDLLAQAAGINLAYATIAKFNEISTEIGCPIMLMSNHE